MNTIYEVETMYKSGRKRTECVISANEEALWNWYDKHHNDELIASSAIIDAWEE